MKITLAQRQSELLVLAESLFQASLVLDLIDDEGFSDEDGCDSDEDDIMDVLELTAFEWTKIAIMDVRWTAWTIQYISQVPRFLFDILAGPRPLFPQNVPDWKGNIRLPRVDTGPESPVLFTAQTTTADLSF